MNKRAMWSPLDQIIEKMDWRFVIPLNDPFAVESYQQLIGYSFPEGVEYFVSKCNAGYPTPNRLQTFNGDVFSIKSLLSFNKHDEESVWLINTSIAVPVAFGIDDFGNLFCFDRSTDQILYWNIKENTTEVLADSFIEFLLSLF